VLAHDLLAEHHGQELVVRDLLGDGRHNVSRFLYTKKRNNVTLKKVQRRNNALLSSSHINKESITDAQEGD
jgi:hypothetical protein